MAANRKLQARGSPRLRPAWRRGTGAGARLARALVAGARSSCCDPLRYQGEIDRTLKKVQEGVEIFDEIWEKVYNAQNQNQKEKFESELKPQLNELIDIVNAKEKKKNDGKKSKIIQSYQLGIDDEWD